VRRPHFCTEMMGDRRALPPSRLSSPRAGRRSYLAVGVGAAGQEPVGDDGRARGGLLRARVQVCAHGRQAVKTVQPTDRTSGCTPIEAKASAASARTHARTHGLRELTAGEQRDARTLVRPSPSELADGSAEENANGSDSGGCVRAACRARTAAGAHADADEADSGRRARSTPSATRAGARRQSSRRRRSLAARRRRHSHRRQRQRRSGRGRSRRCRSRSRNGDGGGKQTQLWPNHRLQWQARRLRAIAQRIPAAADAPSSG
jgi:hypothetical protein